MEIAVASQRATALQRRLRVIAHPASLGVFAVLLYLGDLSASAAPSQESATPTRAFYVRAGATSGRNDGSDWNNAYLSLSDARRPNSEHGLERGSTYYIADGNYGSYTFNDPNSGSTYITIKKATANDHGTATGWQTSYGDGQAVFAATLRFVTDYYIFDGQTRSGWRSGHGFKVSNYPCRDDWGITIGLGFGDPAHYITVRYTEIEGSRVYNDSCGDEGVQLMWYSANTTIEYSWLHEFDETPILARRNDNFLFQYNWVEKNDSSPARHSEAISINEDVDNLIIRYNVFGDIEGTGYIATPGNAFLNDNSNWYIYGNTFYMSGNSGRGGVGDGSISFFYAGITGDTFIYNNTFANFNDTAVPGSYTSSGIYIERTASFERLYIRNNLWWNSNQVTRPSPNASDFRWENNAYFDTATTDTDANRQIASGNPFVSSGAQNFHLNRATNAGVTLPAPYNADPDVRTRGSVGVWDRGAYEYGGGGTSSPPPPPPTANRPPAVSAGVDQTLRLPINALTLSGTASDLDGDVLTYRWSVVSGPGLVTFGAPASLTTSATFSTPGTYILRLTAADRWTSVSDEVAVRVHAAVAPTPTYLLTVSVSGPGSGTVTSNPAGIACGSDCTERYGSGSSVTLTATPASGSSFSGWSGACAGTGTCRVSMVAARSATAAFAAASTPSGRGATVERPPVAPQEGSGLTRGLVGHWRFDESSSNTASDASGKGHLGRLMNGPRFTVGKIAGALSFDGRDDYVSVSSLASTRTLTASFWFYWTGGSGWLPIVEFGNDNQWYGVNQGQRKLYAYPYAGPSISQSVWYHAAVVNNSGTCTIYLNGTSRGSGACNAGVVSGMGIGHHQGDGYFGGKVDEVRIYNRALSATEVRTLYEAGR